eukprot:1002772-Rhodomonas_salina.1
MYAAYRARRQGGVGLKMITCCAALLCFLLGSGGLAGHPEGESDFSLHTHGIFRGVSNASASQTSAGLRERGGQRSGGGRRSSLMGADFTVSIRSTATGKEDLADYYSKIP